MTTNSREFDCSAAHLKFAELEVDIWPSVPMQIG